MYLPLFLHDSQMHDRVADEMFKHLNMKYYQNILTCLNFLVQVSSEACNILLHYILRSAHNKCLCVQTLQVV